MTQSAEIPVPTAPPGVVALAASAGGLLALSEVLADLPTDFPLPVLVVQHLDPKHRSLLADILRRRTRLPVKQAEHGERLVPGKVYVGVPDYHLVVNPDGTLALTRTALVHYVRPSADLLFESAAAAFGKGVIAVVLSGTGSDGDQGVRVVHTVGGTVIAQDEATSEFFGMPSAAIETGCVDQILPLDQITPTLMALAAKVRKP